MQKAGIPAFFIAHYFPLITFFMAPFHGAISLGLAR